MALSVEMKLYPIPAKKSIFALCVFDAIVRGSVLKNGLGI